MEKLLLVRYGDLMLKGHNKKRFLKAAIHNAKRMVNDDRVRFDVAHDRLYVYPEGADIDAVAQALTRVSGLGSYSPVVRTTRVIDDVVKTALAWLAPHIKGEMTFAVSTKRADKKYPLRSIDITKRVATALLKAHEGLSVDLTNPDVKLYIEVRRHGVYLYHEKIPLMGGFPVGIGGKAILLLSGGIDSPVAGYLTMKQGVALDAMHFESTPLTTIESAQKAIDLTKKLALYNLDMEMKLHLVPFYKLHRAILDYVPEPYHITIMRRLMVRVADRFAEREHTPVLISGESIGQVASQTLESMHVTDNACTRPIIRPLATTDKNAIVDIARAIDTYTISTLPFDDCCSVYTPSRPATKPRVYYAERYERLFDVEGLVEDTVKRTHTISLTPESDLNLVAKGLSVEEALDQGGEDLAARSE